MLKFDRSLGLARISCDSCPTGMESVNGRTERDAAARAVDLTKLARWSIEKHAGIWQHFCPACAKTRMRGKLL